MPKVLVTGGAGFIGSHTCLALLQNNYEVFVVDSLNNSSPKSVDRVYEIYLNGKQLKKNNKLHLFNFDIRDEVNIEKIFLNAINSGEGIESVIHFAGLKSVAESVNNPLLYWDVNVRGTISLLKIMEKYDCKTIVFSSSATIYGKGSDKPLLENSEINPINPYGKTKFTIEKILHDLFNNKKDWKIINLRYFNPIGAHPSGLIGENPTKNANNLFPIILDIAIGKNKILKIFGNEWPTHDGTGIRDYIDIMDLSEGHLKSLEYLKKNSPQILDLNLGTGIGTSVLDLVRSFERVNRIRIPYEICPPRQGDVACLVADNTLSRNILDWSPKMAIEDACINGWKWKSSYPDGYI